MKMKNLCGNFCTLAAIACALLTVSCSSGDDDVKLNVANSGAFSKVKLCSVDVDGAPFAKYSFNTDGLLSQVNINGEGVVTLSYNPFDISSDYFDGNETVNDAGFLSKVELSEGVINYLYNGNCQLTKIDYGSLLGASAPVGGINIEWKGGAIGQVTSPIDVFGGGTDALGVFKFDYTASFPNKLGQWPLFLGSILVYGDDYSFTTMCCGLLGIAPEKFPGKIVYAKGEITVLFEFDYQFNADGSIAVEAVSHMSSRNGQLFDEGTMKFVYNY